MLTDARSLPEGQDIEADLCILGAGAAGIALAREFIGSETRVCLIESGGLNPNLDVQALYAGEIAGVDYHALDRCRLRFFGGTTNHWGGTCRPLDEIDFAARDWVPGSGWPIQRSELLPYYERAQPVCQLGPLAYELSDWGADRETLRALPFERARVLTRLFQHSPPTRFGAHYRNALWRASNVGVYLNANATRLVTTSGGDAIERARLVDLDGGVRHVVADRFVLALGAVENARLLLASPGGDGRGLANGSDLVGRTFMDHPYVISGGAVLDEDAFAPELYERLELAGTRLSGFLTLADDVQRDEQLLNFGMSLIRRGRADATQTLGQVVSELRRGEWPDELASRLGSVLANLDDVAADFYRELVDEQAFHVMHWMETTPDPENRVTLADERDALGMPRAKLHWQIAPDDIARMHRAYEIVARELGASELGRLRIDFAANDTAWGPSLGWGCHHIGTTRMDDDPTRGVVDANARLHEIRNAWVAGSSVFPTAGASNPTLTIVALAIRLADRLKDSAG